MSIHGGTVGAHSPSECGGFWYRWLPKERHFVDFDEISKESMEQIRQEITAVSNYFDKPMVFKNLNAGQRMRLISQIFPNAKFIFITREPFYTAQSILNAKRDAGVPDSEFWSIMPPNVTELKALDWPEQITKQIYNLERQIVKDSILFPQGNMVKVSYSSLSEGKIRALAHQFGLSKRQGDELPEFDLTEKITLTISDEKKLKQAISEISWAGTEC